MRRKAAHADESLLDTLTDAAANGELASACARIARRVHNEKIRVVGFVPADDDVAVPPLIIQLGMALCDLTGATIAVVDANVRYPGLPALDRRQAADTDKSAERRTRSSAEGDAQVDDNSVFSTRWLRGSLALLSAPHVERAGEVVPQLARVLLDGAELFAHVLVDLTGFELLGEHGSAAACMDAVAIVGRAHRTHEQALVKLADMMPAGRFLGVLLVG